MNYFLCLHKVTHFYKMYDKYIMIIGIIVLIILFIYFINEYCYPEQIEYFTQNDVNNLLDHVYYINLDHRTDRKKETLEELKKFGIDNPIRYNAIKDKIGLIGCAKSHLNVLKEARKNNYPYVAIFEDDVKFLDPIMTKNKIKKLIDSDIEWNVILLGGNNYEPYHKINNDFMKVENLQCCTSYIVKQSYYEKLINHWEEGLQKLIETKDEPKYALDQYWKILQKKDNFILLLPLKVVQRESYSDIVKGNVNYEGLMTKHY